MTGKRGAGIGGTCSKSQGGGLGGTSDRGQGVEIGGCGIRRWGAGTGVRCREWDVAAAQREREAYLTKCLGANQGSGQGQTKHIQRNNIH